MSSWKWTVSAWTEGRASAVVAEGVRRLVQMLTRWLLAFFIALTALLLVLGLLVFLPAG